MSSFRIFLCLLFLKQIFNLVQSQCVETYLGNAETWVPTTLTAVTLSYCNPIDLLHRYSFNENGGTVATDAATSDVVARKNANLEGNYITISDGKLNFASHASSTVHADRPGLKLASNIFEFDQTNPKRI